MIDAALLQVIRLPKFSHRDVSVAEELPGLPETLLDALSHASEQELHVPSYMRALCGFPSG